jgi:RimJ/RimL family protein N-acetyltransferase
MTDPDFVAFDAPLRDGRTVHIRAIEQSDETEVLQAFDRTSADARYMRFMRAVREPNRERLRKALASMPSKGFGVVATAPAADGFDIVGSATYMVGSDPSRGEFAINVDADYGGAGLGRRLMTALIEAATRRGLRELEGFVLAENRPMLRLATGLGFAVAPDHDDPAVRICRLQLDAA